MRSLQTQLFHERNVDEHLSAPDLLHLLFSILVKWAPSLELVLCEPRSRWDRGLIRSSGWIIAAGHNNSVEFQGCVLGPTRVIPQCLIPRHLWALEQKGVNKKSSALVVYTPKAASEGMNCGFDHLLVMSLVLLSVIWIPPGHCPRLRLTPL